MDQRMPNPATVLPGAMEAVVALARSFHDGSVPETTLELVHLRVSQINSCGSCLDAGARSARAAGVPAAQLAALEDWRARDGFSPPERAALALAESVTRLADDPDPVPDTVWDEAARHHDEHALAVLVLAVTTTNVFNRLNVSTRQVPGGW